MFPNVLGDVRTAVDGESVLRYDRPEDERDG
jgi:hypothetical protein